MARVFIATESGSTEVDGVPIVFNRGVTRVAEGHPLLTAHPTYFKVDDQAPHFTVERATAEPGEQRSAPEVSRSAPSPATADAKPQRPSPDDYGATKAFANDVLGLGVKNISKAELNKLVDDTLKARG